MHELESLNYSTKKKYIFDTNIFIICLIFASIFQLFEFYHESLHS